MMHDRGHLSGFGKKKARQNANKGGARMDVGMGVCDDRMQAVRSLADQKAELQQNLSRALRLGNEDDARKAQHALVAIQQGLNKHVAACSGL